MSNDGSIFTRYKKESDLEFNMDGSLKEGQFVQIGQILPATTADLREGKGDKKRVQYITNDELRGEIKSRIIDPEGNYYEKDKKEKEMINIKIVGTIDIIELRKLMYNIPCKWILVINYINHLYNSNKDLALIKFSLNSFFAALSKTTPDAAEISEKYL